MVQGHPVRTRRWKPLWRCAVSAFIAVAWTSTPSLAVASEKAPANAKKQRWGQLVSSKDKKVFWLAGDKVTIGSNPRQPSSATIAAVTSATTLAEIWQQTASANLSNKPW